MMVEELQAGYKGKAGDCVVRSIAIVTIFLIKKFIMIFFQH